MTALLLTMLVYAVGIAITIAGGFLLEDEKYALGGSGLRHRASSQYFGWIPFAGLKILKPQEALVLTLFGNYIGTLKGEGFYFVNPFCAAVNTRR